MDDLEKPLVVEGGFHQSRGSEKCLFKACYSTRGFDHCSYQVGQVNSIFYMLPLCGSMIIEKFSVPAKSCHCCDFAACLAHHFCVLI